MRQKKSTDLTAEGDESVNSRSSGTHDWGSQTVTFMKGAVAFSECREAQYAARPWGRCATSRQPDLAIQVSMLTLQLKTY